MSHPSEETLNDYVDELLTESERTDVELHLDRCADCKQAIAELQSLVHTAAALGQVEPARDLLPGIRSATGTPGRSWLRWAAAAAVVSLALLAGFQLGTGDAPTNTAEKAPEASLESLLADFRSAEAEYIRATETLAQGIEARRGEIAPETLAVLDTNLALIDSAISEVQLVLDRDGVGVGNTHVLTALYSKKLDVLLQATRLSS